MFEVLHSYSSYEIHQPTKYWLQSYSMNHNIDTSKTSFLKKKMEAYTFRALKISKQIFCPWLSRFKNVHSMDQIKLSQAHSCTTTYLRVKATKIFYCREEGLVSPCLQGFINYSLIQAWLLKSHWNIIIFYLSFLSSETLPCRKKALHFFTLEVTRNNFGCGRNRGTY